jgi:hypothetical protein
MIKSSNNMFHILIGAPITGILIALASVAAEQLLVVGADIIFKTEITSDFCSNLGFFIVAAAIIEEIFKYFAVVRVIRHSFGLQRFKSISAALICGLFFGLTETYYILLANEKGILDIKNIGSEMHFSLLTVILTHILTAALIAVLIAAREKKTGLGALKVVIPASFIHILVNFLVIQKGDYTNWLVEIVFGIVIVVIFSTIAFNFRRLD